MGIYQGKTNEVIREIVEDMNSPIVSCPSRDLLMSVPNSDGLRLLVDEGLIEQTSKIVRMELSESTSEIRETNVPDVSVRDPEAGQAAIVDRTGPGAVAAVIDSDPETITETWREADSVEFDVPEWSEFVGVVSENAGREAGNELRTIASSCLRGDDLPDLVTLSVWAGAVAGARRSDIVDALDQLGLSSPSAVSRRISRLKDETIIRSVPVQDGSVGRPETKLVNQVPADGDRVPRALRKIR